MTNVRPCVKGRTLSRDTFTVQASQTSLSHTYEKSVGKSMFSICFSIRMLICYRRNDGVACVPDYFMDTVSRSSNYLA